MLKKSTGARKTSKSETCSLKQAALAYAKKGWPVFPCRANKKPYTENGVLDATTSKKKIKAMWSKHPNANIGCDMGGAGFVTLDLDPGHDVPALEKAMGESLPKTKLFARTPRGGLHLHYAKSPDETIPASSNKDWNIDVRSFHSYCLLPPSKTSDGVYTWEGEGKPAYRPGGLIAVLGEKKDRSDDHDTWIIDPDLLENVSLCIRWLKTKAQIAIEGVNGDQMAYNTAAMCKSYGISPEMALDLMWEHWSPRCSPPWTEDDFEHLEIKVRNGYEYNTSQPGNMTPAFKVAKAQEMFKPVSRETSTGGMEFTAGKFRAVSRKGMGEIKPPSWLIDDCIPQDAYAMLIGPRGTFKTFIALDMALSIATNSPYDDWLGPWPKIGDPGPVLFAAGEGRSNIVNRVQAWEKVHLDGEEVSDRDFILMDPVPMPTPEDVTPFIELALGMSDTGYSMCVLDTVGRSMRGLNENTQQDASRFSQMVEEIQHELQCTVLAIHHTGHGDKDRARGSSVFGADTDTEFVLDKKEGAYLVSIKMTKQKDAEQWKRPKFIQLNETRIDKISKSLVAVRPDRETISNALNEHSKSQKSKKGPKEPKVDPIFLGRVVVEWLSKNKATNYSHTTFANMIATDERIKCSSSHLRQNMLKALREDTNNEASIYWDALSAGGSGRWGWKP